MCYFLDFLKFSIPFYICFSLPFAALLCTALLGVPESREPGGWWGGDGRDRTEQEMRQGGYRCWEEMDPGKLPRPEAAPGTNRDWNLQGHVGKDSEERKVPTAVQVLDSDDCVLTFLGPINAFSVLSGEGAASQGQVGITEGSALLRKLEFSKWLLNFG